MSINQTWILLSFVALTQTSIALAAGEPTTYVHEITGESRSAFFYNSGNKASSFAVLAGYHYRLLDNWQLSTDLSFSTTSGFTSVKAYVGPTFNFGFKDDDFGSAFFLTAQLGVSSAYPTYGNGASVLYSFSAGKRFSVTDKVSWRPHVSVSGGFESSTGNLNLALVPLSFSFFL